MERQELGSGGPMVSRIGLGCMGLSGVYGEAVDQSDADRLLARAVELGITFFDTAEVYGPFTNEILIGKALRGVREQVTIATKFGFAVPPEGGRPRGVDSRPEHIRAVCDASLARLGVDTIDLFYQHRVDPAVPIEDVAGAVGDLVSAGKVRFFGLSEASADTIRRAHAVHPVSALQSEYSLWSRGLEAEVLPACRTLGIGLVAYSPLGRGFLAGAAKGLAQDDHRRSMPRWSGAALANNMALADTLESIASAKALTSAQLALAWVLHQGDDIVPIPGTRRIARLEENAAAASIALTAADIAAIEAAVSATSVQGGRYEEAQMAMVER